MKFAHHLIAAALTTAWGMSAFAQNVTVTDAWARATVPGQKATGAFMVITAKDLAKLVAASTPVAGITEIHEMKMDKDVMRMSPVGALELPAGKTVELKPGGYHVMLMDLKNPLADKSNIPLTLTFEDAKGQKSQQVLQVPVRAMNTMSTHKH
jgi:copper(I)-binding protein